MTANSNDEFIAKGAVEQDRPAANSEENTNTSMAGQLGHRDKPDIADTSDTDFPEPGQSPEHTGEPMEAKREQETEAREREDVRDSEDQDPGERQRRNQNDQKDDPLAA
jgi:hypothetical protein